MASEDGRIRVVFNGEIYNHHELRRRLESEGFAFRTRCDTEVLVHGYRRWGRSLPERLEGMFAFACWDSEARRLLLARDRMGKKPLHYLVHEGSLWFASEIKALLQVPGWSREIDPEAVDLFLSQQFIPAPLTVYREVRKLLPAHRLEVRGADLRPSPYWTPVWEPKLHGSASELAETLRDLCRRAVRARLESEVPLGAFLSGGVDSSSVVALMAEAGDRPVKTYTIGFEEAAFDERAEARRVAERFATNHHEHVVRPRVAEDLPRILAQYDEPFGDKSAVPTWYVAREAAREITVVLNGDGADDVFAGYPFYRLGAAARWLARLPASLRRALEPVLLEATMRPRRPGWLRHRLRRLLQGSLLPHARSLLRPGFFAARDKLRLYRPEFLDALGEGGLPSLVREGHRRTRDLPEPLDRLLAVDLEQYLAGDLLPKVDISTMAHSLEARSPFLDREVVEFGLRLTDRARVEKGVPKAVVKRAFASLLPEGIAGRPKRGFSVPVNAWLAGELAPMLRDLLLGGGRGLEPFFRPEEVRRLVNEHVEGRRKHGGRLWLLLCFELWHRSLRP